MKLGTLARSGPLTLLSAIALAAPAAAQPPPDRAACADAFEASQIQRRDGLLKASRQAALTCSHEACPKPVREECGKFLPELEGLIPSVVVTAKDASGADVVAARLLVDGDVVGDRLDGKPIELDPGEHEIRIEPAEREPVTQKVILAQGEQGRIVTLRVDQPPARSTGAAAERGGVSPLAWWGFGVGGAGILVGLVNGAVALFAHPCRNAGCDDGTERDVGLFIAHTSTINFIVGGAGLALGVVGLVVFSDSKDKRSGAATALRVGPGHAAVVGRF